MHGYRAASASAWRQCVVARRPSSSPAAASTNAPLQMLATRAPRRCASRSASSSSAGGASSGSAHAGTTTVSAAATSASVPPPVSTSPCGSATGAGPTGQSANSYQSATTSDRSTPNTSHGTASSNTGVFGGTGTTTR